MQIDVKRSYRASKIKGTQIRNAMGEDVGMLGDLVIDLEANRIIYGVLNHGGFFGFGASQFVIPWEEYGLRFDESRKYFMVDIDPAKLAKSQGVNLRNVDFASAAQRHTFEETYRHIRREHGKPASDVGMERADRVRTESTASPTTASYHETRPGQPEIAGGETYEAARRFPEDPLASEQPPIEPGVPRP